MAPEIIDGKWLLVPAMVDEKLPPHGLSSTTKAHPRRLRFQTFLKILSLCCAVTYLYLFFFTQWITYGLPGRTNCAQTIEKQTGGLEDGPSASFVKNRTKKPLSPLELHHQINKLKCQSLRLPVGAEPFSSGSSFHSRNISDRFAISGDDPSLAIPTIIHNATIWTGEGRVIENGWVWLEGGIIRGVGGDDDDEWQEYIEGDNNSHGKEKQKLEHINADGKWLTPGILDLHSHVGVYSSPSLEGAADGNSNAGNVLPWLRSLDGLNGWDMAFERVPKGGVTSALVLPGSANSIGGQAFLFKWRSTRYNTPQSMLIEPPYNIPMQNVPGIDDYPILSSNYRSDFESRPEREEEERKWKLPKRLRWRHMKMACGENPHAFNGMTRMDEAWEFRSSFQKAKKLIRAQDEFCERFESGHLKGGSDSFPEDLQWEALTDLLRGRVKLNVHCYETTDLDAFIRHTQEFRFPVSSFHHAHSAYLVPERLKQTYGGTPAIAMFSGFSRYKRESWRWSDFAPAILHNNNISVVFKSDHAEFLDSRYLLLEAAEGHHYGLPVDAALSALTTTPAKVSGMDHRLGYVKKGYDADIVLWDSHPLSLGTLPSQVYIDGIPQIQNAPKSKAESDVSYLPPQPASWNPTQGELTGKGPPPPWNRKVMPNVVFVGVKEIYRKHRSSPVGIQQLQAKDVGQATSDNFTVVVSHGKIACMGNCEAEVSVALRSNIKVVDLKGGSILPPITSVGAPLGLVDIEFAEPTTQDGSAIDPFENSASWLFNAIGLTESVRAIDGLSFSTKSGRWAYHYGGVSRAVVFPQSDTGMFRGISVAFRLAAQHGLEKDAILKEQVALHFVLASGGKPGTSSKIAALRRLLLSSLDIPSSEPIAVEGNESFRKVVLGELPIVIEVDKADIMVSLLRLKREIDFEIDSLLIKENPPWELPIPLPPRGKYGRIRMIFSGAAESHLIADEIREAGVGVFLTAPRVGPNSWDNKRVLDGPPISDTSLAVALASRNVSMAFGTSMNSFVRSLIWEVGMAVKNSAGRVSREAGVSWITSKVDEILGLEKDSNDDGEEEIIGLEKFVAFEGDIFDYSSRPVAISDGFGGVDLIP